MHVVGEIGGNEVVTGDGVVLQVSRQFGVRANMVGAKVKTAKIGEIDKWIMAGDVLAWVIVSHRTSIAGDALLIRSPGDACVSEEGDQVVGGSYGRKAAGSTVSHNTKVSAGFEPKIIGQTGMQTGWIVILRGRRGHRNQGVFNVRAIGPVQ